MARNYIQPGNVVDYHNETGSEIASGDVVVLNNYQLGIALATIANNATGPVALDGVYLLPKDTGALTAWQLVYWNIVNNLIEGISDEGLLFIGYAAEAAADSDTTCKIALSPTGATGPAGAKGDKGDKGDTGDAASLAIDENIFGFMPTVETSLAFNDTTFVFTLGVTGTTFSYYRSGIKHTITGAKTVTLPGTPPTATKYYIYIDSTDGTLIQSTTPWNLADTKVMVASITFNNALTPKYILCDERHPCDITRGYHRSHHFTEGTQLSVIPTITTLTPSSDNLVSKRPTLSLGAVFDETLYIANAALTPTGSPYTATDYAILYRTAASTWAWKKSSMPFSYNAGTGFIQYDLNGTLTDGSGGAGGNARWFNSYLVQTDAVNDGLGYCWIAGRGSFTSLALAQAEDPATFAMTGFPILEYGISMQLTWAINETYTSAGKCVYIAQKQVKTGNIITGYTSVVLAPSATVDTTQVVYSVSGDTTAAADGAKPTIYLVSGTTTLTLPTAIGNHNRYTIVNVGVNTVTIATTSSQTINGTTPGTLATPYALLTVISDGANWIIV